MSCAAASPTGTAGSSAADNNTLIGNLLYDMVRFYDENGVETDMQRSARIYAC